MSDEQKKITIRWTAVPAGVRWCRTRSGLEHRLCVSVVVTPLIPRLEDQFLQHHAEEIFSKWPTSLQTDMFPLEFELGGWRKQVRFGGGDEVHATPIQGEKLWQRVALGNEGRVVCTSDPADHEPRGGLVMTPSYEAVQAFSDELNALDIRTTANPAYLASDQAVARRIEALNLLHRIRCDDPAIPLSRTGQNGNAVHDDADSEFKARMARRLKPGAVSDLRSDILAHIGDICDAAKRWEQVADTYSLGKSQPDSSKQRLQGRQLQSASSGVIGTALFHMRAQNEDRPPCDKEQKEPDPKYDLMQRLTFVRTFPRLARALGVIIDFSLSFESWEAPGGNGEFTRLRVGDIVDQHVDLRVKPLGQRADQVTNESLVTRCVIAHRDCWPQEGEQKVNKSWYNSPDGRRALAFRGRDREDGFGSNLREGRLLLGSELARPTRAHSGAHLPAQRRYRLEMIDRDAEALSLMQIASSSPDAGALYAVYREKQLIRASTALDEWLQNLGVNSIDAVAAFHGSVLPSSVNRCIEAIKSGDPDPEFDVAGQYQLGDSSFDLVERFVPIRISQGEHVVFRQILRARQVGAADWTHYKTLDLNSLISSIIIPQPRTMGFALIDTRAANEIKQHGESNVATPLYAPHLVAGYAVDVAVSDGPPDASAWTDICLRSENYSAFKTMWANVPILYPAAQGMISVTTTKATDEAQNRSGETKEMYLSGKVFEWDGWDLVSVNPLGELHKAEREEGDPGDKSASEVISDELGVIVDHAGKPPALVYSSIADSKKYWFRLRSVDIAGNACPIGECSSAAVDEVAIGSEFIRCDPVSPPLALLDRPLDRRTHPTRALDRLVLLDLGEEDIRWFVPPSSNEVPCSWAGMLTGATDLGKVRGMTSVKLSDLGQFPLADIIPGAESAKDANGSSQPDRVPIRLTPTKESIDDIERPYLPDPHAKSITLRCIDMRGVEHDLRSIAVRASFYPGRKRWPNAQPIGLRLKAARGQRNEPRFWWDSRGRCVVIELPPGYSADLFIGSIDRDAPGATQPEMRIRLRHSKGYVIRAAEYGLVSHPSREPNVAHGQFHYDIAVDCAVAGAVESSAEWDMQIDDPEVPAPEVQSFRAPVEKIDCKPTDSALGELSRIANRRPSFEFPDTRRRVVRLVAESKSRYMPDYPAHDRRIRTVTSAASSPILISSSARPDPPKIAYAIPLIGKSFEDRGNRKRSASWTTRGLSLRVFFERPWYSSGDGELLGVVLSEQDRGTRSKLVSRWGRDPIWDIAPDVPLGLLEPSSFDTSSDRYLDQIPGIPLSLLEGVPEGTSSTSAAIDGSKTVSILLCEPEYDAVRRLWFADFALNRQAKSRDDLYRPFLRLGLVRYQKDSVHKDLRFSTAVATDIVQLTADRVVTISRTSGHKSAYRLQVTGTPRFVGRALSVPVPEINEEERPGTILTNTEGLFEVELYQRCAGVGETAAWISAGETAKFVPDSPNSVDVLHSGSIEWPEYRGPLICMIREYEYHASDLKPSQPFDRRVVWSEAVLL